MHRMKSSRLIEPLVVSAELFLDPPVNVGEDPIEFAAPLVEDEKATHRLWFRFPRAYASQRTRRAAL